MDQAGHVLLLCLRRIRLIAPMVEEGIVYVLSKCRGGHMANATSSHSRSTGTWNGEITVVDSWNLPHTARWRRS